MHETGYFTAVPLFAPTQRLAFRAILPHSFLLLYTLLWCKQDTSAIGNTEFNKLPLLALYGAAWNRVFYRPYKSLCPFCTYLYRHGIVLHQSKVYIQIVIPESFPNFHINYCSNTYRIQHSILSIGMKMGSYSCYRVYLSLQVMVILHLCEIVAFEWICSHCMPESLIM